MTDETPEWILGWQRESGHHLTDEQVAALREVDALARQVPAWDPASGRLFEGLALTGPPDDPVLVIYFADSNARRGGKFAYEWHINDPAGEFPDTAVDLLAEDLVSTPGLPEWASSEDGLVHVDLQSTKYRHRALPRSEDG